MSFRLPETFNIFYVNKTLREEKVQLKIKNKIKKKNSDTKQLFLPFFVLV